MSADQFRTPKGRMTIRAGLPGALRAGRANRRIRPWTFEAKPGSTLVKLEKAYMEALAAVDSVAARRDTAAKSGQFTGVRSQCWFNRGALFVMLTHRRGDLVAPALEHRNRIADSKLQGVDVNTLCGELAGFYRGIAPRRH